MKIDELKPNSWACVLFGGYKTHFCPSELVGDLIADIEARGGGEVIRVEETKDGGADLPGMILADRPWEDIMIGEFKLGFPSQDFEHFLNELATTQLRKFVSGKEYYKIHGWLHCVVFTPEQRDVVLEAMEKMLPEVKKRRDEADERFNKAIKKLEEKRVIAPKITYIPVPPKDRN